MRKILLVLLFLFCIGEAKSQMWKQLPLAKISDSIYIDETEVSIKDWVTYLSDLIHYNPQIEIHPYLPDTNKIRKDCRFYLRPFFSSAKQKFTMNETPYRPQVLFFPQIYPALWNEISILKNVPMSEVPITGITFEQANAYCAWRAKKINFVLSTNHLVIPDEYKHKKITIRLVTPDEFVRYASLRGFRKKREIKEEDYLMSYRIDSIVPHAKCITFLYNYKSGCAAELEKYGYGPLPPALFFSDFLTVYDWHGNVAEMTSEKGIAKGGSFAHYAREADPKNNILYQDSEEWLGFRCILEVE